MELFTVPGMNATNCFECNLPETAHATDGAVYVNSRFIGGKPVLWCSGFVLPPSQRNASLVEKMVQSDCAIFGKVLEVKTDGWAVVQGPGGRIDEIQVARLVVDPT